MTLSFYDRIQTDTYRTTLPCPKRPAHVCEHCGARFNAGAKFCGACGEETNMEQRLADYRTARAAYQEDESRLVALFKQDCLREACIEAHPYAEELYAQAWEQGHGSGFTEVWTQLQDLAERFEARKVISVGTVAHAFTCTVNGENFAAFQALINALPFGYQAVLRDSLNETTT